METYANDKTYSLLYGWKELPELINGRAAMLGTSFFLSHPCARNKTLKSTHWREYDILFRETILLEAYAQVGFPIFASMFSGC